MPDHRLLPSGKRLHSYRNSPFGIGKSTISMAISKSYNIVDLPIHHLYSYLNG